MDDWVNLGAMGAFAAGISGSFHCALMCGPLACVAGKPSRTSAVAWHLSRTTSYVLLGAVLGASGSLAFRSLAQRAESVLPWLMAMGLLMAAWETPAQWLSRFGLGKVAHRLHAWGAKFSPATRACAMGASTPFLPCGLVYGISLAALASGTALGGALLMGAFAVGGAPALAATQVRLGFTQRWRGTVWFRRAVPVLAALVLVLRALGVGGLGSSHCH